MEKVISGFAFHCHHDTLFEWVAGYDERVAFIKEYKLKREVTRRLKLFQMIPEDRIPKALLKAREAYDKAIEARAKAIEAYGKAIEAYGKAEGKYTPQMKKLHSELCPDCPWNGKTIFPKEGK